jgi:hypothetical protein
MPSRMRQIFCRAVRPSTSDVVAIAPALIIGLSGLGLAAG